MKTKSFCFLLFVLIFALLACNPNVITPATTASTATVTPSPSPTATLVPFEEKEVLLTAGQVSFRENKSRQSFVIELVERESCVSGENTTGVAVEYSSTVYPSQNTMWLCRPNPNSAGTIEMVPGLKLGWSENGGAMIYIVKSERYSWEEGILSSGN